MANISKNKMNKNVSKLFAVTCFTLNIIVLKSFPFNKNKTKYFFIIIIKYKQKKSLQLPCDVLKPVRNTQAMQPLSGALLFSS